MSEYDWWMRAVAGEKVEINADLGSAKLLRLMTTLKSLVAQTQEAYGRALIAESASNRATTSEEWRPIPESEVHEVSNLGRIRRKCETGYYKVLKLSQDKEYKRICLKGKSHRVHRLVADAFIPHDPLRPVINHIDRNRSNNAVSNLERVTQHENVLHDVRTDVNNMRSNKGEKNPASKLTEDDVRGIRDLYEREWDQAELACLFGVSQRSISLIVRREKWSHVV